MHAFDSHIEFDQKEFDQKKLRDVKKFVEPYKVDFFICIS